MDCLSKYFLSSIFKIYKWKQLHQIVYLPLIDLAQYGYTYWKVVNADLLIYHYQIKNISYTKNRFVCYHSFALVNNKF